MLLKYRDGTECDDRLFDQELSVQRRVIANELRLNSNDPDSWPLSAIDNLLGVRRAEGVLRFHYELLRMLNPRP